MGHFDLAAQLRAQLSAQAMQQQFAPWPAPLPLAEPVDTVAGVDGAQDTTSSDSSDHQSAKKQKTTTTPKTSDTSGRRRKKPTYYDEMKELQLEIDALQARLQTLEEAKRLGVSPSELGDLNNTVDMHLRDVVHSQQLSIASVQSVLGGYLNKTDRLPHESTICLGKDRAERHATLLAMKDKKLEDSLRYLAERTRFLDPMIPHAESCRYIAPSGTYCCMCLDITHFEGAKSAKQVFDALMFYFFNMEISISEIVGDLTIREDDGVWHDGVFQSRIVSNVTQDVQVEINSAMFSAFYDRHDEYGGGRPFGVIASDFVNVDELHPYLPTKRVREDVTALLTVSSETRTKINAYGEQEEELVVVLTRSCLLRLDHGELSLPPHVVQLMRDSIGKWGNAMLLKAREIVYSQVPGSSR
ncbi:hypothetical protein FI667_g7634, partial [Globisporangium splendens]